MKQPFSIHPHCWIRDIDVRHVVRSAEENWLVRLERWWARWQLARLEYLEAVAVIEATEKRDPSSAQV